MRKGLHPPLAIDDGSGGGGGGGGGSGGGSSRAPVSDIMDEAEDGCSGSAIKERERCIHNR